MRGVSGVGLGLAKQTFEVQGVDASGQVVIRKRRRRHQMPEAFGRQPACPVAREACFGAHVEGREIERLGPRVRLIPPADVTPFAKRRRSDLVDAEATQRPTMRLVADKGEVTQAA